LRVSGKIEPIGSFLLTHRAGQSERRLSKGPRQTTGVFAQHFENDVKNYGEGSLLADFKHPIQGVAGTSL
jgi:hypothetical protein